MRVVLGVLLAVSWCAAVNAWAAEGPPVRAGESTSLENTLGTTSSGRPTPASIGPFKIAGPDGTSWLRIRFFGQMMVRCTSLDAGGGGSRTETTTMGARRIRPILELNLPEPRLFFRLHMSAAPHSLELMDMYFDIGVPKGFQARLGQYKVPFTQYRIQSFQRLTLVDWPITTRAFGAERQMGFAVHNGYENTGGNAFVLGIFTGVNARRAHAVLLPLVYGEEVHNPSDLADPGRPAEFHPELFLHLLHKYGEMDVSSPSDEKRGPLRYSIGFSAAYDFDPEGHQDFALRLASEMLAKYRGISLNAVAYAGFSEMWDPAEAQDEARTELAMVGLLIEPAYRINSRYEVAGRYALVDLSDDLLEDISRWTGAPPSAPAAAREEEFRAGLNVYLAGHALKWQNDFGALRHHREGQYLTDYVFRSQFQLAF